MIATAGHSSRTLADLVAILRAHRIDLVADVRSVRRSRRHPQFEEAALRDGLEAAGIAYRPLPRLGGLRRPRPGSPHTALAADGLRGYADHMETAVFREGLEELVAIAAGRRVTVLCAEARPEDCHRGLLSDALVARGIDVTHLLDAAIAVPHRRHPAARIAGDRLVYDAAQPGLPGLGV